MPLKDLLKKRDKIKDDDAHGPASSSAPSPEFTFLRTDTNTQEIIQPPSHPDDTTGTTTTTTPHLAPKRPSRFRSASSTSVSSRTSSQGERRLSQRLHLRSHSYASSRSSVNLPEDLPDIENDGSDDRVEKEARWEERATILAKGNPLSLAGRVGGDEVVGGMAGLGIGDRATGGAQASQESCSDTTKEVRLSKSRVGLDHADGLG